MRRPRTAASRALVQGKKASQAPSMSRGMEIELWNLACVGRQDRRERLEAKVWELGNLVGEELDCGFAGEDCGGRERVGRGDLVGHS